MGTKKLSFSEVTKHTGDIIQGMEEAGCTLDDMQLISNQLQGIIAAKQKSDMIETFKKTFMAELTKRVKSGKLGKMPDLTKMDLSGMSMS